MTPLLSTAVTSTPLTLGVAIAMTLALEAMRRAKVLKNCILIVSGKEDVGDCWCCDIGMFAREDLSC